MLLSLFFYILCGVKKNLAATDVLPYVPETEYADI